MQIGKMLHGREPKVVNGPEILNKYVGESEANIRKLFADAEAEYKARGENSSLHIIIFDEIDAICKVCERVSTNSPCSRMHVHTPGLHSRWLATRQHIGRDGRGRLCCQSAAVED